MQSARYAGPPMFARGSKRRALVAWAALPLVVGIGIGVLIGGDLTPPAPVNPTPTAPVNEPPQLEYTDMPCDPGSSVLVLHSLEGAMPAADVKVLLDYETLWVRYRENANPVLRGQTALLTRRDDVCDAIVPNDPKFTQFVWIGPFQSDVAPSLCEALLKVTGKNCIPAQVVR
ncbi:hypothetical protein V1227_15615 [Lentzea sp. DG1S-22]|uniref:hypothetical protein n=1 Tax=Lentzea sp. DG1S-22 TaxID=3108822 RepID=UPI002E78236A|nr:hypothetical protein [Lentzea sp. DG1S-22]WVH84108.1 hypothetical protein V1227_15615 [Lentzea sp. DG1S-22]